MREEMVRVWGVTICEGTSESKWCVRIAKIVTEQERVLKMKPLLSFLSSVTFVIRGRSDKYLAYKRETKILEKWRFISQHSLLLARYT